MLYYHKWRIVICCFIVLVIKTQIAPLEQTGRPLLGSILSLVNQQSEQDKMMIQKQMNQNPDIRRFQSTILIQRRQAIQKHNSQQNITYQLGINQYALLSEQQIRVTLSLYQSSQISQRWSQYLKQEPQYFQILGSDDPTARTPQSATFILDIQSGQLSAEQIAPQQIDELENQLIAQLRKNLEKRGLSEQQIQESLQKFAVVPGPLQQNQNTRRLLQARDFQIILYQLSGRNQFQLGYEIQDLEDYNVDWSCFAGQVKNQGIKCGSCYAFASVDTYSMFMAIYKFGFFASMSVQSIISCSTNKLTLGCQGGYLEGAYLYMMQQGLVFDNQYPYSEETRNTGQEGQCIMNDSKTYKIKNYFYKRTSDCNAVRLKLQDQPLTIGIAGNPMFFYKRGIFNGCKENQILDHAVVLIAYEAGRGWKIKNSWGRSWGQNGFAWLADGNTCGVCKLTFAMQPDDNIAFLNYINKRKRRTC